MLMTEFFILEKLDYTMHVRKAIAIIIMVSLPVVSVTYLVQTDMIDVNVFSENFFIGLENTQELETQLQTNIGKKINTLTNSIGFSHGEFP